MAIKLQLRTLRRNVVRRHRKVGRGPRGGRFTFRKGEHQARHSQFAHWLSRWPTGLVRDRSGPSSIRCERSNKTKLRKVETSHDFFSLRFSLQYWYRWKEGNNSGITSKFEVDPSKRRRVRAERSRKVERKSDRTLEICSVAQSRFRPPPGARTCMHYVACKITVPDRCASVFSFLFFSFFFSTSFLWLHQVEICTTISSSLHWFFALYTINLPWP